MGEPVDFSTELLNSLSLVASSGLMIVGKLDSQLFLGGNPIENSPGISKVSDINFTALNVH